RRGRRGKRRPRRGSRARWHDRRRAESGRPLYGGARAPGRARRAARAPATRPARPPRRSLLRYGASPVNARLACAALLALAALAAGCSVTPEYPAGTAASSVGRLERQILLTVAQPRDSAVGLQGDTSRRYLRRRAYGPTPEVERTLNQLAREHGLRRVDGWPIASLDVYCEVLEVSGDRSIHEVLGQLAADPRVDIAQPMNAFHTLLRRYDDPYADLQSSVALLELERAHEIATGKGITVAVVDSAVDARHAELRRRVRFSRDFVGNRPVRRHAEIHGTAVAGVIAASANDAEGIVGVAPEVTIAALRACWADSADGVTAHCS